MCNPEDPPENANVISIHSNAKRIGVHTEKSRVSFPTEWKSVCLEAIDLYREEKRIDLGWKRLGWQNIRDEVMRDFDEYNEGKKYSENTALTRQDFESWHKGLSVLSDQKFIYVDRFVRQLTIDGKLEKIRTKIIRTHDAKIKDTFASIYSVGDIFDDDGGRMSSVLRGKVFSYIFAKGPFRHVILAFGNDSHPVQSLTALLITDRKITDIENDKKLPDGSFFMKGLSVPINIIEDEDIGAGKKLGKYILEGTIKFFRPEYRGAPQKGYADVGFTIYLDQEMSDLTLTWANHLVSDYDLERSVPVFKSPIIMQDWHKIYVGEMSYIERMYLKNDDGYIMFQQCVKDGGDLEKIISQVEFHLENSYKGYVF